MIADNYIFYIWKPRICLCGAYKYFGVIRNTYAGSIVERIYSYYCRGSQNTFVIYNIYYKKEFSSFEEFLERKFNLSLEDAKKFNSKFLCHKELEFQPGISITDLLNDGNMYETFINFLGGDVYES